MDGKIQYFNFEQEPAQQFKNQPVQLQNINLLEKQSDNESKICSITSKIEENNVLSVKKNKA